MLDILRKIFDTLLPPHPTILNLRSETPQKFLRFYLPKTFLHYVVLSDYKEEVMRTAIKANKFHNDQHASKLLSILIAKWLGEQPMRPTILIPIPLSSTREKDRGYNQVTRVLEKVVNGKNILLKNLLIRIKDTRPQTKMNRDERLGNMNDVFVFQGTDINLQSYRLVLIDDVVTTGATMSSAYKVLKGNLPEDTEIVCLALTH